MEMPNRMKAASFRLALVRMYEYPRGVMVGAYGDGTLATIHESRVTGTPKINEDLIKHGSPSAQFAFMRGMSCAEATEELADFITMTPLAYRLALHRSPTNLARLLETVMEKEGMLL